MTAVAHPAPAAPIRVPAGTTAAAAVREAGLPGRGAPDAIVVVRDADGKLRDLSWIPDADVDVVPVAADTDDGRSVIRHSAAHVLAQAVQDLFPAAKLGIGPPITDGFYYDFDVADPFTPEDLDKLEKRMRQIVKEGQLFDRRVYESKDQARGELADGQLVGPNHWISDLAVPSENVILIGCRKRGPIRTFIHFLEITELCINE